MAEIYLLRQESGAREDYWPCSAHSTLAGAVKALETKAEEYGMTVIPANTDGDPYPHAEYGDTSLFISVMNLED